DALLEPGVLEAVKLVAAPEARIHGGLLLGVLDGHRTLDHPREGRPQAFERRPEGAIGAADPAGIRAALDLDRVIFRIPGAHVATKIAVTRALMVASGRRIFQPNDMSWS